MHIHTIIIEHEVHHLQCHMLSSAFLEVVYIITLGICTTYFELLAVFIQIDSCYSLIKDDGMQCLEI